jgi:predicted PurR-regulated permease PerM
MKKREIFSGESLVLEKLPAYVMFALMIWVGWKLLEVMSPFLDVLIFSAIVATITFPIYARFEKWFKGKKRLASAVTCLIVVFVILIPLLMFLLVLFGQAVDLYNTVNNYLLNLDINTLLRWQKGNFFYDLSGPYSKDLALFVQQNMEGLKNAITEAAKFISSFAAKQSARLLTDLGVSIFNLLLMFFTLYFLYKDGRFLLRKAMIVSPIPLKHEQALFQKFNEVSKATLFGTVLTAVAQGIVAWIGFSIAGVPSAFFWGTAVSIFSLIPTVGTSIVWFPMGLIMLIAGNIWGVFILLWGFLLISTVDNVLRVIFIGSTAKINPLLTFVTVFGGMLAFGLIGVVYGPMLLVIFITLLHVYELEYADKLDKVTVAGLEEPKIIKKK